MITTSPKPIDPGALDAAINLAFATLRYKDDKRVVGAYNLEPGGAEEALYQLLRHRSPDVVDEVLRSSGFDIALNVARIVIQSPLTDCSAEISEIVDRAIEEERDSKRHDAEIDAAA